MDITEPYKNMLLDEIAFARRKITEEQNFDNKIFYYSATFGMTRRILNFKYDPQLQFVDFVLTLSYQYMLARLTAIKSGDLTIPLQASFFDDLVYCLEQLEEKIRNNDDIYIVLQKIVNLTSLTDGNGYYLSQKGIQVFQRE
ncbi:MAG: hypothetical protein O8C66_10195 [Candidatus Methanoperedens sp.]|nr:hypothetical protein [Candidatus Methanoperedens sp.]MCZ7370867.1 hypothetical protein [Candidatus Methanoperedens sp.]